MGDGETRVEARAVPKPIGSPDQAFDEVLRLIDPGKTLKVLDAPAGRGTLVRLLLDRGHDVSAADIVPEIFQVQGVPCRRCDLNDRLPYDDGSFDLVTSCNGLHRVYGVGRAISEYARVLRPGGRLLVTTPNFISLKRRLAFLFTGVISRAVVESGEVRERPEANFRQPVGLPQILTAFEASGLDPGRIRPFRNRRSLLLLTPLMLLVRAAGIFVPRRRRAKYHLAAASSFAALYGDFLLIEGRKRGG